LNAVVESNERRFAGIITRGVAYLLDCAIVFGLFAALQLLVFSPLRSMIGIDEEWFHSGVQTQIYTLTTISLPVWLYFALTESSPWQATVGKKMLGLRVVDSDRGERIRLGRALIRTFVKLLPWEIAHLSNNLPVPVWYAEDPGFRIGFAVSGVLMVVYMAMVAFGPRRQGPHDLVTGAVVLRGPKVNLV
jgi:uncharacterized RDD family membrane protein YckC